MKKILSIVLFFTIVNIAYPCTTAVISGKATKDGRPMIWKLRDTETFKNKLRYFTDGRYHYIGLINSEDINGEQVWGGSNAVGFAIMNSASYNVNLNDTTSFKDQEGFFMKEVLQKCKTLADFEELLKNRLKPMGLAAHFGVIDADGGAAFYEVNNYTFTKFDANETESGYVIRTNYSYTGEENTGYGFIRCETAEGMFKASTVNNKIDYQTILQDYSRSFKHSLLKKDYRKIYETQEPDDSFVNSGDFITRHGSSSNLLIKGVKKGESADLTTFWTMIGFTNTTIALPVWVAGGENLPNVLTADTDKNAPLNDMALQLKDECYPMKKSSGYKYLKISKLINADGTGIVQQLEKAEETLFSKTDNELNSWYQQDNNKESIKSFYNWMDDFTLNLYKNNFNVSPKN